VTDFKENQKGILRGKAEVWHDVDRHEMVSSYDGKSMSDWGLRGIIYATSLEPREGKSKGWSR